MVDIDMVYENQKFKYRVCGIIKQDDKFLIQKIEGNSFYCLAGGHVELGEDSKKAVKRELKEEIGIDVKNEKLIAVIENFFVGRKNKEFHELGFFYLVEPSEKMDLNDFSIVENDKDGAKTLEYKWVTVDELQNLDFRPVILKDLMKNLDSGFKHIINYD